MLNWKIENEYGFETYTQTICCRTTENKVIPITPENVEISGSAELVNLSGDAENPVYSIRVTGTATITFSNTFSGVNNSANRLTFMAMVNNHSSVDGKIHVYNKSQTLVVGAASNYNMNDCPVMLKIGEAYGNENFFDANEKLQIVVESSNPNAEMYIDFLTVGNAVTIS